MTKGRGVASHGCLKAGCLLIDGLKSCGLSRRCLQIHSHRLCDRYRVTFMLNCPRQLISSRTFINPSSPYLPSKQIARVRDDNPSMALDRTEEFKQQKKQPTT
ncbi:uncharacterized protein M421DRAFT_238893 [Didymella exigua CBS 183.55]|uniref:Uncharacterized protein n=1 Tax=Didymella exigua CBS 183.55 TaxID=1150837 RepID=A0A6A5RBD3_9PLEO|nr:uncharacterized protein M421DRAFT_238893 [Didymella exigua CBS 183.55]KAF1925545.1 hypothetical protein M421DRAFT_238893 [Didymella exigua CBS 183.55]